MNEIRLSDWYMWLWAIVSVLLLLWLWIQWFMQRRSW